MSPASPASVSVSVILPVRNRAILVEAAARSVLDQKWTDLELIVVDGGSTDGTVAVLHRLAASDARVRLLLHDKAEGVSAARNAGARLARGRLLAFQDSDDSWRPETLARQVA
ncbi:MAG: teichuronic acid biosynthesis glycosyltransferase TuaG, partial [Thermoplasmata archaeon]|nr:teichuronic acid biosynthesis glycosyltransferase TuaG [Thermoplasmata archaeon]